LSTLVESFLTEYVLPKVVATLLRGATSVSVATL
jgi:hypothetical protein